MDIPHVFSIELFYCAYDAESVEVIVLSGLCRRAVGNTADAASVSDDA